MVLFRSLSRLRTQWLPLSGRNFVPGINGVKKETYESRRSLAQYIEKAGETKYITDLAKYQSLITTGSADFLMRDGLSRTAMYALCNFDELRRLEGPKPGNLVVCRHYKHYIYFLLTRARWFEEGSYQHLWDALIALRNHCDANKVQNVVMGRLGVEDMLEWDKVRELISVVFEDSDLTFTIYPRTEYEDTYVATYDNIMDVSSKEKKFPFYE